MAVVSRSLQQAGRLHTVARSIRMLGTLATWLLVFVAVGLLFEHLTGWGQYQFDDLRYGMPRTAQTTGYVGHGDERHMPTHIVTLNLNGQVSTLVLPGGDIDTLTVLPGPYIVGATGPYAPAVPTLQDVNADGHVDLLVTVRNETVVYVNKDGQFVLITPEEQAALREDWDG